MIALARAGVVVALVAGALGASTRVLGQRARPQAQEGTLRIEGDFPGAEVYVDAELVGTLPLGPLPLAPGNHTLRVSRPGYTEHTEVVRIRRGQETVVVVDLMPLAMALRVESSPQGARVFVDGQFAGETPIDLELSDGQRSIRVAMTGYRDTVRVVQAVAGTIDTLRVTLEPLPPEEREAVLGRRAPRWYERPVTWIAVGGGALAAAAAVVVVVMLSSDSLTQVEQFCRAPGGCVLVESR
ncbi:MAG: PEGA domain-containing protein [Myxococcota bacterium]|nr:PEGA domain-containing protein [Myxococcota bacterium]MDW8361334.1 PEGA domain-containing protein [Myxococcales bacterium]